VAHLRTWWARPRRFTNFGDELGHIFLERLGHTTEWVRFGKAEILTTGSILQKHALEPLRPGTIVWGTGYHKDPPQKLPALDVRAVRGHLTADMLGVNVPLGDPGLLASHFWAAGHKKHRLGFVRHYVDMRPTPFGAFEIDTRQEPEDVCRQIAECEAVVSSSLHGCIVAASYGIPFMRLYCAEVIGGDTKWTDFATSMTRPIEAIQHDLLEGISDL